MWSGKHLFMVVVYASDENWIKWFVLAYFDVLAYIFLFNIYEHGV